MVFTTRVPGMFSVVVTIMCRDDVMLSADACIALPPERVTAAGAASINVISL
jgi:hypothetical protein